MEDVHAPSQPNCVDRAIRVASMVLDDLQNTRAPEPSQRFRVGVLSALLGHVKCKTHRVLHLIGKSA